MIEGWRTSRASLDNTTRHLLALFYRDTNPDGSPTMSARIGAMHLTEGLDNIRALKLAWTRPK